MIKKSIHLHRTIFSFQKMFLSSVDDFFIPKHPHQNKNRQRLEKQHRSDVQLSKSLACLSASWGPIKGPIWNTFDRNITYRVLLLLLMVLFYLFIQYYAVLKEIYITLRLKICISWYVSIQFSGCSRFNIRFLLQPFTTFLLKIKYKLVLSCHYNDGQKSPYNFIIIYS